MRGTKANPETQAKIASNLSPLEIKERNHEQTEVAKSNANKL
jgi:hypothetical protein